MIYIKKIQNFLSDANTFHFSSLIIISGLALLYPLLLGECNRGMKTNERKETDSSSNVTVWCSFNAGMIASHRSCRQGPCSQNKVLLLSTTDQNCPPRNPHKTVLSRNFGTQVVYRNSQPFTPRDHAETAAINIQTEQHAAENYKQGLTRRFMRLPWPRHPWLCLLRWPIQMLACYNLLSWYLMWRGCLIFLFPLEQIDERRPNMIRARQNTEEAFKLTYSNYQSIFKTVPREQGCSDHLHTELLLE